jgi:hypothetical protein
MSSSVFLRFPTHISAVTVAIMTDVYRGFPQFIQENHLDCTPKEIKPTSSHTLSSSSFWISVIFGVFIVKICKNVRYWLLLSVCLSVCLSELNNSITAGRIFIKFCIGDFMLFLPCIFLQVIHQPPYALNKTLGVYACSWMYFIKCVSWLI